MKRIPTLKLPAKRKHARFAPSSAHRWMVCGASIPFCEEHYPGESAGSDYADEGTVAHSVHEDCLKLNVAPVKYLGTKRAATKGGKLYEVDAEMVAAVELSVDAIREEARRMHGTIHVEANVFIPVIGDDGHPDAMIINDYPELSVWDFKYGKGHAVEVNDNDQMFDYALGALHWARKNLGAAGFDSVAINISQPRAPHDDGPIRRAVYTTAQLRAYEKTVKAQIALIESGKAPFFASKEVCKFCPGKALCPHLAKEAIAAAGMDFKEFIQAPIQSAKAIATQAHTNARPMSPKDLGQILFRLPLLFLWANAVEVEAVRRIGSKQPIPGWKLVEGKANRRWRDAETTIKALIKLGLKPDQITPRKLLGITDIQAQLSASKREAFMAKHTEKPVGKPTLAPESDSRPALSITDALDDFADHIETE